ncbi:MAG: MBL fold metallo-hydrolase [bacterium]|nr:MBL fold metallo-hydrolase [bacterium]
MLVAVPGQAEANAPATAAPLALQVYNPGAKSIFPVSSEIVTGRRDAILIDAQFQTNDAAKVVRLIKASGKRLTTVYISHSDPDYYFGLSVVKAAFPDAKIVAMPSTVAAIKLLMKRKLAYWGPILKGNAPKTLILPAVLDADHLTLEGRRLDIEGLHGSNPTRTFVWIPSLRTVVGGPLLFTGTHVWMADSQTPAERAAWQDSLRAIEALHPREVVPGHYLGPIPPGLSGVQFVSTYISRFEAAQAQAPNAAALIAAMERAYPNLPERSWLELGANVIKGDMRWPQ